jgi:hypothetical protein
MCPTMTSVITTMKSSLQASISSLDSQFVAFICKGRRGSRTRRTRSPPRGQWLRVIDLIVDGRGEKLKAQGDESASYVLPDDATADILSAI